jgi:hypothetical protein
MTDTLRKHIETARGIVERTSCGLVGCCDCAARNPGDGRCVIAAMGNGFDDKAIQWFRDWLAKNDPKYKGEGMFKVGDKVGFVDDGGYRYDLWGTRDGWKTAYGIITKVCPPMLVRVNVFSFSGSLLYPNDLSFTVSELKPYEEKEIIGWPGNAEEMRQYIGRKVMVKEKWEELWEVPAIPLTNIFPGANRPYALQNCWTYIKILPDPVEPKLIEVTAEEAIAIIAKEKGVNADTIRIKRG